MGWYARVCTGGTVQLDFWHFWRIRATAGTSTNLCWDVHGLGFLGEGGKDLQDGKAIDSDNVENQGYTGYKAQNAFDCHNSLFWGGRTDQHGELWLGRAYPKPVKVVAFKVKQADGARAEQVGMTMEPLWTPLWLLK